MSRNKIYAIVEGHGEADAPTSAKPPAVYALIRIILRAQQCYTLVPAQRPPIRLRSCGDFDAGGKLEDAIRSLKYLDDCCVVLVLRDLDDGCAAHKGPEIAQRIRAMEALPFSVIVVCAVREYEAWFLASLETIHTGRNYPGNPETIRAAKGWLEREFGYREVRDQSEYTSRIDVNHVLSSGRSRSFQRLYEAFTEVIQANQNRQTIVSP